MKDIPTVEPYVVQDTLATDLVRVEELRGGLMRFVFAVDQFNGDIMEKVVVSKVVISTDAAREAAKSTLHITGRLLMRNCTECIARSCH